MGTVVQACEKRIPRAASVSKVGVSTASDSKPTLSARVVSSVTNRIDGHGVGLLVAGCGDSGEHPPHTRPSNTRIGIERALFHMVGS
jgi:hypothetical protein